MKLYVVTKGCTLRMFDNTTAQASSICQDALLFVLHEEYINEAVNIKVVTAEGEFGYFVFVAKTRYLYLKELLHRGEYMTFKPFVICSKSSGAGLWTRVPWNADHLIRRLLRDEKLISLEQIRVGMLTAHFCVTENGEIGWVNADFTAQ